MDLKRLDSPWSRLSIFAAFLMALQGVMGCGGDGPTEKKTAVVIPITPGIYDVVSTFISCADTSGKIDTVSVDSTGVACEFDATGLLSGGSVIDITDSQIEEIDGHYIVALEARVRFDPCRIFFRIDMEGDVTDTTVNFVSTTYVDKVTASNSVYDSFCRETYASFPCTTITHFDAVWVGPDTAGVCSP